VHARLEMHGRSRSLDIDEAANLNLKKRKLAKDLVLGRRDLEETWGKDGGVWGT
jgi:hypothetical protein